MYTVVCILYYCIHKFSLRKDHNHMYSRTFLSFRSLSHVINYNPSIPINKFRLAFLPHYSCSLPPTPTHWSEQVLSEKEPVMCRGQCTSQSTLPWYN